MRSSAVRSAEFDTVRPEFPPSCHPDTIAMYDYWHWKRAGRSMPARSDIDPIDMPRRLLPFINLVDAVADDRRYVYRLVGTADVEIRGNDPTGKSVKDGFFGPSAEDALNCYNKVVGSRAPFIDPTPFIAPSGRYVTQETIFLPLSDDGVKVNMILVFSHTRDVGRPTFI